MGSHWINITTIDDQWEVEMDENSRHEDSRQYRHRPRTFARLGARDEDWPREEDWRRGRPPTGRHSRG